MAKIHCSCVLEEFISRQNFIFRSSSKELGKRQLANASYTMDPVLTDVHVNTKQFWFPKILTLQSFAIVYFMQSIFVHTSGCEKN